MIITVFVLPLLLIVSLDDQHVFKLVKERLIYKDSSLHPNADLAHYIQEVKSKAPLQTEALPSLKPETAYRILHKENTRNPFKRIVHRHKVHEFLEAYPLDALEFVGTLAEGSTIWALIKLPDLSINYAQVGHHLGLNHARIVAIKKDAIHLIETKQDSGSLVKNKIIIKLKLVLETDPEE